MNDLKNDNTIYVIFNYINQCEVFKGNLLDIKNNILQSGYDNEWNNDVISTVKSLNTKREIKLYLYHNMDCHLL